MIPEIKRRYSDAILAEAAQRFGVSAEGLKDLGGFESHVYEYEREGVAYILKVTHTIRRSVNYLMGELEWLNYLADNGVRVARAIPSVNGEMVEVIPEQEGGAFLVISYEKAEGHRATADDWNEVLFRKWGRLLGKTHRLTKSYQLSDPAYKRQEWYEEEQLKVEQYLPSTEAGVIEVGTRLIAALRELPMEPDSYGLLHTDLHSGNYVLNAQGELTAFDFDDAGYTYFVNDISIVLYYSVMYPRQPYEDRTAFVHEFLTHFLAGYYEENDLDRKWLSYIPDFMMVRHVLLFTIFYTLGNTGEITEKERENVAKMRREIESGAPLVEIDLAAL